MGKRHFELVFFPGSLKKCEGSLPLPNETGLIEIKWRKKKDGFYYQIATPVPIYLHLSAENTGSVPKTVRIDAKFAQILCKTEQ